MAMKSKVLRFLILIIFLIGTAELFAQSTSLIGKKIQPFTLKNIDHSLISINGIKQAKGFMVIFTCNHCPFAKLYSKRLNELNKKYKKKGVPLLAINSMDSFLYKEESFELMQQIAKKEKYNFPYLQDATQKVGKNFEAQHTPKAYVIWKEINNWVIEYEGVIDNDGEHPEKAHSYLSEAVEQLLNNKKVSVPKTESFGCRIFYRKS